MFADQALNTYSINHIEKTLKMQILSTSPPPAPLYAYNVLHLQSDIFASLNHLWTCFSAEVVQAPLNKSNRMLDVAHYCKCYWQKKWNGFRRLSYYKM